MLFPYHLNHHVWNNLQLLKLGQLSFVNTQKSFRQTEEKKIVRKSQKNRNIKMPIIFFQEQSQLHEVIYFCEDLNLNFMIFFCDCLEKKFAFSSRFEKQNVYKLWHFECLDITKMWRKRIFSFINYSDLTKIAATVSLCIGAPSINAIFWANSALYRKK